MKKIKYYLFAIKWLWNNKEWQGTRQKYKALDKAYNTYVRERGLKND